MINSLGRREKKWRELLFKMGTLGEQRRGFSHLSCLLIKPSQGCCVPFQKAVPCLAGGKEQRDDRLKLTLERRGTRKSLGLFKTRSIKVIMNNDKDPWYDWWVGHFTFLGFLPQTHNPSLTVKKTSNPDSGTFYKIPDHYPQNCHQKQGKSKELFQSQGT